MTNKNAIFCLIILLFFTVAGCSPQYRAEKAFYQASRYAEDIFKDPKNIPHYKFNQAIKKFERIVTKYPESRQARQANFIIGNLYFAKEQYSEALKIFEKIMVAYPGQKTICAEAVIKAAQCYEKKNDWENAYRRYRYAVEKFPCSLKGLETPLYLLRSFQQKKDKEEITNVYKQTVADYQKVISEYPDSKAAYTAGNFLAEAHMRMEEWPDMLKILNAMYKKYSQSRDAPVWLMTMAATYEVKLRDREKAREYYQLVMDKYKDSPWSKEAKKRLKELKKPKK